MADAEKLEIHSSTMAPAAAVQNTVMSPRRPVDMNVPRHLGLIDAGMPFYAQVPLHAQSQPHSASFAFFQQPVGTLQSHYTTQPYNSAFNMGHMAGILPQFLDYLCMPSQIHQHGSMSYQRYPGQRLAPLYIPTTNFVPHSQYTHVSGPATFLPMPSLHMFPPTQSHASHPPEYSAYAGYLPAHPSGFAMADRQPSFALAADQMISPTSLTPERAFGSNAYVNHTSNGPYSTFPSFSSGTNRGKASISLESSSPTSIVRGPPRKPRQSGHALWVGNLPFGTNILDLKDHFSQELTQEIESVKLISKSNCAFVNYRTKEACDGAVAKFADSRFHNVRLVCRVRRESGPAEKKVEQCNVAETTSRATEGSAESVPVCKSPARYFILKSLKLGDLDLSVQHHLWATQSHNENVLNEAYETAEDVYLIFSANKSGEYYGYARMKSAIVPNNTDMTAIGQVQAPTPTDDGRRPSFDAGPRTIPTPATQWAPRGRIIDDRDRSTIFWEIESETGDSGDESAKNARLATANGSVSESAEDTPAPTLAGSPVIVTPTPATPSSKTPPRSHDEQRRESSDSAPEDGMTGAAGSGNVFHVEWLSVRKLQFFKTKGLRNAYNGNRDIKIARDGTEVEPVAAKRLLALFGPLPPTRGLSV